MATLFSKRFQALDANGNPYAGAQLFFYRAGTSSLIPIYKNSDATTPHTNPVVADAAGAFPAIFVASVNPFKIILKTAAGVTIDTIDHIPVGDVIDLETLAQFVDQAGDEADRAESNADRAENAASSFSEIGTNFQTVSVLLADEAMGYAGSGDAIIVGAGDIVTAQGFRYEVVASDATDYQLITAGGVKLYALVRGEADVAQFGAIGVGDETAIFAAARDRLASGDTILAPGDHTIGDLQMNNQAMRGNVLRRAAGADQILKLGNRGGAWRWRDIKGLDLYGAADFSDVDNAGDGIVFTDATNPAFAGRWGLRNLLFQNLDRAIVKPAGNIGNVYDHISALHVNYAFYAVGSVTPIMQPGCDQFIGGYFAACYKAAFYIDGIGYGYPNGQIVWQSTIMEANPNFALFLKNIRTPATPPVVKDGWFEANGASPDPIQMPDGLFYDPVGIHFENVDPFIFERSTIIDSCKFIASNVLFDGCVMVGNQTIENVNSTLRATNVITQSFTGNPVEVESYQKAQWAAGANADTVRTVPRESILHRAAGGVVRMGDSHDADNGAFANGVLWTGSSNGQLFEKCADLELDPAEIVYIENFSEIPAGHWAVYLFEIEHLTGEVPNIELIGSSPLCGDMGPLITETNKMYTVGGLAHCETAVLGVLWIENQSEAACTLRVGACQVVSFEKEADAVAFFNSRAFVAA